MRISIASSLVLILAACGDSSSRDEFTANPAADGGTLVPAPGASNDPGFDKGDSGPVDVPPTDDCTDEARRVYVLGTDGSLHSFEPATLAFTRIGVINCASVDDTAANRVAMSMGVDRSGTAWVNLANGQTYKVSTKDASCSLTGTTFKNTKWSAVTLGFATDSASSTSERMYMIGPGKNGAWDLGKFDTTTLQAEGVGTLLDPFRRKAELTGTGDGRLFGFFQSTGGAPMILAGIDKATAAVTKIVDVTGTGAVGSTAYAFSFWGGDFWFYFSTDGAPSKVIRYKAATDKSISVVVPNVGDFRISGAGVSTCAPTVPPVVK